MENRETELKALTIPQLKQIAEKYPISLSGTKPKLIQKILEYESTEVQQKETPLKQDVKNIMEKMENMEDMLDVAIQEAKDTGIKIQESNARLQALHEKINKSTSQHNTKNNTDEKTTKNEDVKYFLPYTMKDLSPNAIPENFKQEVDLKPMIEEYVAQLKNTQLALEALYKDLNKHTIPEELYVYQFLTAIELRSTTGVNKRVERFATDMSTYLHTNTNK